MRKISNTPLICIFPKITKLKKYIISYYKLKKIKNVGHLVFIGIDTYIEGGKYIILRDKVMLGKRGILTAWDHYNKQIFTPKIILENGVNIGDDFNISSINYIHISENVLCGRKVTIIDHSHGNNSFVETMITPLNRALYSKGAVIIKRNVWIGDKVTICPNVTIGENTIIGANSVVTKSIPANCVAGGNPARILKFITE